MRSEKRKNKKQFDKLTLRTTIIAADINDIIHVHNYLMHTVL